MIKYFLLIYAIFIGALIIEGWWTDPIDDNLNIDSNG